jgi:hypothetical protein
MKKFQNTRNELKPDFETSKSGQVHGANHFDVHRTDQRVNTRGIHTGGYSAGFTVLQK